MTREVAKLLDRRGPFCTVPAALFRLMGSIEFRVCSTLRRESVFTPGLAEILCETVLCDSSKAIQELDYRPSSLSIMLDDCYRWMVDFAVIVERKRQMTDAASLIGRVRRFQFYAQHFWRFHRIFLRGKLCQRCVNCIISEAYSPLDAQGLCSICRASTVPPGSAIVPVTECDASLEAELDSLLGQLQGQGSGAHDALVMLSGGKDSALLVHELKRRYPRLRILALTIDNSFMSPVALQNVRKSAEILDVDVVTLRPAKSVYVKSFRFACTLEQSGSGCFETVDRIDADLGFSLAKNYAAINKIPLLVTGLSWDQVERILVCIHSKSHQTRRCKELLLLWAQASIKSMINPRCTIGGTRTALTENAGHGLSIPFTCGVTKSNTFATG